MTTVAEVLKNRTAANGRLEKEASNLYNGFYDMMKQYYKPSALERKYKELMAVTASVITRCEPCLAHHMHNAVTAGATRDEVVDAAAIGVEFGGGPSFVFVREHLMRFLDEIVAK